MYLLWRKKQQITKNKSDKKYIVDRKANLRSADNNIREYTTNDKDVYDIIT